MTEPQKKTATMCALASVALLSAAMVVFATLAATGRLIGDQPMGALFLRLASSFGDLGTMLKALSALVLPGVALLGASYTSIRSVAAMTVVLASGILACIVLLLAVGDDQIAANLWGPSRVDGIHDDPTLQDAARPLILWTGGALSAALVAFLGLAAAKKDAA